MIDIANLKKRLSFVGVAVPIAVVIVSSQIDIAAFLRGLFNIPQKIMPLPIYPGQILALLIVLFGIHEYMHLLGSANKKNGFWLGYIYIIVMSVAYLIDRQIPNTVANSALLIIVVLESFFYGRESPQGRWKRASLFLCGLVLLNIASIGIMSLFNEPFKAFFNTPKNLLWGNIDVTLVITAVFLCDGAAYFVGSAWGKHKFSKTISPNKTIEGSLGGLAASTIFMTACWFFLRSPEYPLMTGVKIGLIIGAMAQIGDLLMSLVKRYFHVKDTSNIIPGHGGILDRFDSLFFTAPVLYLYAWLVIELPK